MTSLLWLVALVIGGVGGALNAVLTDHARLLPSIVTLTPGGTRVVRIGIVGNILTGMIVTLWLFWAIQAAGSTLNANGSLGLVLLGLSDLFISFVSARWVTNEVDKLGSRRLAVVVIVVYEDEPNRFVFLIGRPRARHANGASNHFTPQFFALVEQPTAEETQLLRIGCVRKNLAGKHCLSAAIKKR